MAPAHLIIIRQVSLQNITGPLGDDINFQAAQVNGRDDPVCAGCSETMQAAALSGKIQLTELPTSEKVEVATVYSVWPQHVTVPPKSNVTLLGLQVIVSSLNSSGAAKF
jgi:hypothetical protein